LTVTDDQGHTGTGQTTITVGTGQPTADFTFSPGSPTVGQTVNFNGATSTAIPGRTIANFAWDFGDGTKAQGRTASHVFAAAGDFTVTLVVTDDQGQVGSTTKTVTVATTPPTGGGGN